MTSEEMKEKGLAYPKCYGCGHTYYGGYPVPLVNGKPKNGGLCRWCIDEDNDYERCSCD